jgi:hypothetical protein
MEKHILSKSTFIRGTQCLKSLYLNKKRPFLRNRLSDAQRAIFKRGTDVGVLAQQLFPGGIDMKPRSPALYRKQVGETMNVIQSESHDTLYEATFQYDRLLILLDILVHDSKGWSAYEVKSSLKISETFLLDAAFQYYVITHAGVALNDFYLVVMNPDYVLNGKLDISQLFVKQSVLEDVKVRQPYIEEQIEQSKEALNAASSPKITIGTHCRNPYPCDFSGHCWKKIPENSLLYLDAFAESERFARYYAGDDAPEDMKTDELTPLQKIQLTSAIKKEVVADSNMIRSFAGRHLDSPMMVSMFFAKPAVPFLKGTRPYQRIPVAAIGGKMNGVHEKASFFIQDGHPVELFEVYFRNLLSTNHDIVIYDKHEVINYLSETADSELIEAANARLIDYRHLIDDGILFHYLLRGDYSPENIARIFLKEKNPGLNPALLGMGWQRKLFEMSHDYFELMAETTLFLEKMLKFQFDFARYLKNNF